MSNSVRDAENEAIRRWLADRERARATPKKKVGLRRGWSHIRCGVGVAESELITVLQEQHGGNCDAELSIELSPRSLRTPQVSAANIRGFLNV
jgi:hypothetical protein